MTQWNSVMNHSLQRCNENKSSAISVSGHVMWIWCVECDTFDDTRPHLFRGKNTDRCFLWKPLLDSIHGINPIWYHFFRTFFELFQNPHKIATELVWFHFRLTRFWTCWRCIQPSGNHIFTYTDILMHFCEIPPQSMVNRPSRQTYNYSHTFAML